MLYPDRMLLRLYAQATRLSLRLMGAKRKVLEEGPTSPISLVYYTVGPDDGEPWVLLHGLGAVAATWLPVMRALSRGCRVLVPELSSLGGTRSPRAGLGVLQGAWMVARLIEKELRGRPANVTGISLGGWTAVRLALRRPDLISRLVLIDAGGYRDQDWDRIEYLVKVNDLEGIDRLYKALFARVPWFIDLSRQGFLDTYTSPSVTETLEDLEEHDTYRDEDLARLRMPTALIWGEKDGLFKVEVARAMAAVLPQVHLEVIPDCGHAVHIECPRKLVEAIERFRASTAANGLQSPSVPRKKEEVTGWPAPST
ncbi:MAG TPA: alpha/beta hydrolase [Thermoanaerobaculia bacterium]|nr:alpha/beta hydrolase [Thermoanaerobaculia bacterium]